MRVLKVISCQSDYILKSICAAFMVNAFRLCEVWLLLSYWFRVSHIESEEVCEIR